MSERTAEGIVAADSLARFGSYVVEDQVGFLMRKAQQRHTALFLERMAVCDLTATQFTALIKIVEMGQVTQNLLGRLAAMDPATIQGVVRRLVARGLASRARDPMDRRTVVLAATPAGRALAVQAVAVAHEVTAATLAPLDEVDQMRFLALLRRLG